MKTITRALCAFFLFSALVGCSTLGDARNAKGQGTVKIYHADFDKTWNVVHQVINELGLPMAGENKAEGYILAQNGMSFFSYGENVAIFVEKTTKDDRTKVEVVSKRAMSTNVLATNWELKIIGKLDEEIR